MRFRFCWDCDCPEWLLAEMVNISKMKSDVLLKLCCLVAENISAAENFNYGKALQLTHQSTLDESTTRAIVAALRWILESASGSETEPRVLSSELQQLGLPKEHTAVIERTYQDFQDSIRDHLKQTSLKASSNVKWSYDMKGIQVDSALIEPVAEVTLAGPVVELEAIKGAKLGHFESSSEKVTKFMMTGGQVQTLLRGLKEAQRMMEELE